MSTTTEESLWRLKEVQRIAIPQIGLRAARDDSSASVAGETPSERADRIDAENDFA